MAISITNIGVATGATSVNPTVAVPAGGVPANALIVVAVADDSLSGVVGSGTMSDTINTYLSTAAIGNNNAPATNGFGQMFYSAGVSALTNSNSITYTKVLLTATASISAFYATGIATSSPLDTAVTATATSAGANPSVTSGTPSVAGELFVAILSMRRGAAPAFTQDTGHGWAIPPNSELIALAAIGGGTQVNAGTGTITFSPTITTGVTTSAVQVFGFKAASAIKNLPPFQRWAA